MQFCYVKQEAPKTANPLGLANYLVLCARHLKASEVSHSADRGFHDTNQTCAISWSCFKNHIRDESLGH